MEDTNRTISSGILSLFINSSNHSYFHFFVIDHSFRRTDVEGVWKMVKVESAPNVPPPLGERPEHTFTLHTLDPDTEYEFQVSAVNPLGEGAPSRIVNARTQPYDYTLNGAAMYPTDSSGATFIPSLEKPSGLFVLRDLHLSKLNFHVFTLPFHPLKIISKLFLTFLLLLIINKNYLSTVHTDSAAS